MTCTPGSVCGNQQCEAGEACATTASVALQVSGAATDASESRCCPADCPVVVQSCAADAATGVPCSGHGSCLTGAGVCRCFQGYLGDDCGSCDPRYLAIGSGGVHAQSCVFLAGIVSTCGNGVRDGTEMGIDCGGVCPVCAVGAVATSAPVDTSKGTTLLEQVVSGTVVPVAGIVIAVVIGVVFMVRRRDSDARRHVSKLRGEKRKGKPAPELPVPRPAMDRPNDSDSISDRLSRIVPVPRNNGGLTAGGNSNNISDSVAIWGGVRDRDRDGTATATGNGKRVGGRDGTAVALACRWRPVPPWAAP